MNETPSPNRLLKPAEVAAQLGIEKVTLWKYCRNGQMPHIRLNQRNFRVRQSDLDQFINSRAH